MLEVIRKLELRVEWRKNSILDRRKARKKRMAFTR